MSESNDISFRAPALDRLSKLLPQYEFRSFIAQGGMGAVYLAVQRGLDREVAIKVLPRELGADPDYHASFVTEARAMAKLNHPNLIGVYDFGDADGMPYIVMEYVSGESLYHSSYGIKVAQEQAVIIVKGICDGLAHAHSQGLIHRDIKPANVLLTPGAQPKIADFGLARPAGKDESGVVMGTPGYVAPEVLNRPDLADKRSDIFAVGVILYELLTGLRAPFENTPPASKACGCDIALDRICERAMNPLAALRYQTVDELSLDLSAWLSRLHSKPTARTGNPSGARRGGPPAPRRMVVRTTGKRTGVSPAGWLLGLLSPVVIGLLIWKTSGGNKTQTGNTMPVPPNHEISPGERVPANHDASPVTSAPNGGSRSPLDVTQSDRFSTSGNATPAKSDISPSSFGSDTPPSQAKEPAQTTKQETAFAPGSPVPVPLEEIDTKAKELIGGLETERSAQLEDNSRFFLNSLDAWVKRLPKDQQDAMQVDLANFKNPAHSHRLPPSAGNMPFSQRLTELYASSLEKQKSVDDAFRTKAEVIRSSYQPQRRGRTRRSVSTRRLSRIETQQKARYMLGDGLFSFLVVARYGM